LPRAAITDRALSDSVVAGQGARSRARSATDLSYRPALCRLKLAADGRMFGLCRGPGRLYDAAIFRKPQVILIVEMASPWAGWEGSTTGHMMINLTKWNKQTRWRT
jgi:hypothetical protein